MKNKRLLILSSLLVIASAVFIVQRCTQKPTSNQTIETEKNVKNNVKTHRTIKTVKTPDGTITTEETIDTTDRSKIKESDTKTITVWEPHKAVLNVSLLATVDTTKALKLPTYGISVSKEVFGPFTAGAIVLFNGTVGLSIGANF